MPKHELPEPFHHPALKPYLTLLQGRRLTLALKRVFDLVMAIVLILLLSPVLLGLAIWVKLDSKGPVFFFQERVGRYGRPFRIFKFRTMAENATGLAVTVGEDPRITRAGHFLRKLRLDELPQLFNIVLGDMSFVGTRPEVPHYVAQYTPEMWATLLLAPGVTSPASIRYKDESTLLAQAEDPERTYVEEILPAKMAYNLAYVREFSLLGDLKILVETVGSVLGLC